MNDKSLDRIEIMKLLPHRDPFLHIDRIVDYELGESIIAEKIIKPSEPYFEGHFPGQPIVPGVIIIEAMAQAGGFLVLNSIEKPETKLMYFTGINNSRFKKTVTPGDQLYFEVSLDKFRLGTCKIIGVAKVNNQIVAEAEMMASVVERRS